MKRGRPTIFGSDKVAIRVVLSQKDYLELENIANLERTDISTLVRRAIARYFLVPNENNNLKNMPK
jgi:hypothetical protein